MPVTDRYRPDPRHLDLGETFFDPVEPAIFPEHRLRFRNDAWAARIGLDGLTDAEWIDHFGRFRPLPGNLTEPLALRYHGHQFRSYNADLGDGRGFLFAQLREDGAADGRLLDLGTKGSGQTPYSRQGDGRLTLKGGVRELLATEMLEALGVETSKTLSVIETGESLWRGDEPSPTRSCVLVRLNHSHIRIGSFQRQAFEGDVEALQRLADHVTALHMPDVAAIADRQDRVAGMVRRVAESTARTTAQWMAAGFVHGVLNTDNILITGQSFDYGPWRFLPTCDGGFTAAYFDPIGLYAYGRQAQTLSWNLARLGDSLLPICDKARLDAALATFPDAFAEALRTAVCWRLGLAPAGVAEDDALVEALFPFLEASQVPFERPFFDWYGGAASAGRAAASPVAAAYAGPEFAPLGEILGGRRGDLPDHPYFQGAPCTMRIEEVEALWAPIAEDDDWRPLGAKIAAIRELGQALRQTA